MPLLLLLACAHPDDKGGDDTASTPDDGRGVVTAQTYELTTDRDGYVTVDVDVGPDVNVLQVIGHRDDGYLSTDYLYGPDGTAVLDWEDWYDSSYSLTECFFMSEFATTMNWPVRADDGPLAEGTWQVSIAALNASGYYQSNKPVTVEVLTRREPDFAAGTLYVDVAYANGVRDEPGVPEAVEAAVAYWSDLYAAIGVTLVPTYGDIDVDPAMPDTYEGLDAIREWHENAPDRSVLVVIGETIAGDKWTYGEAGGIPGPYGAADHAAVEVAWLTNAGADATFQESDVLIMGETMAHEVGHYLGLFHPVEDGWNYWDALEDTEDCTAMGRCESALGSNLMFPYPVCTGIQTSSCERQNELTEDQAGVVNRYVGVE